MTVSMNYRGSGSSPARSFGDLRAPPEGEAGLSPGVHAAKGRSPCFAESIQRRDFFFKKRWILMLLSYLDTAYIFQGKLTS